VTIGGSRYQEGWADHPENVNTDHFVYWFDKTFDGQPTNLQEVASRAWFTVMKRFDFGYLPDQLDKYGFGDWWREVKDQTHSPYGFADMAWHEAKREASKYVREKKKKERLDKKQIT
jgi:hypothetical protein